MISKKILVGFVISPLATAAVISALAIVAVMMATSSSLQDAADGIDRLFIFCSILSYGIAVIVGIPLVILSIRHQWRKLWQNAIAGFLAGLGLGGVAVLVLSLFPSIKWMDSYSPFIAAFFFGIAGSVIMSALWPFIEQSRSDRRAG